MAGRQVWPSSVLPVWPVLTRPVRGLSLSAGMDPAAELILSSGRVGLEAGLALPMELPYDGAKAMLLADVDRRELLCRMVQGIADDLSA